MAQEIRHRRLHAFYQSKVLNALMILECVSLLMIGYMGSITLPAICASIAFALFLGYSLWLWIKKPRRIVINNMLSEASGFFTLYFIVVGISGASNPWWYGFPVLCAIVIMFVSMIKPSDEVFEI